MNGPALWRHTYNVGLHKIQEFSDRDLPKKLWYTAKARV